VRINRLELAGFGPFRGVQKLDFDAYRDDGIFLIEGKTGAGKSSILDAICFALYGAVPRYEGTQAHLRSDHCEPDEPTYVTLEFTTGEHRYSVTRSPEYDRPKKRGAGTTTSPASAELAILRDGGWEGVAARAVDVANELDAVVGLRKDQFLQVILLAQNRFQKFLQAGNDDRQAVLRSLFGTRRFEEYEQELKDRASALKTELDDCSAQFANDAARAVELVDPDDPPPVPEVVSIEWLDGLTAALEERLAEAATDAARADAEYAQADTALRTAQELRRRQTKRAEAERAFQQIGLQRSEVDAARGELGAAQRATAIWAYLERQRETDRTAASAADALERARRALENARPPHLDDAPLEELVLQLSDELGALGPALAEEATLPQLAQDVETRTQRVAALAGDLARAATSLHELPIVLQTIDDDLVAARVKAGGEPAAAAELARLEAAHAAAVDATAIAAKLREAQQFEVAAAALSAAAALQHAELLRRRWAGHAAELALQLVAGEACVVCGSHEHPAPARSDDDLVSEGDIEESQQTVEGARAEVDAARDAVRSISEALATKRALAGEQAPDELASLVAVAQSTLADCTEAVKRVAELEKRKTAETKKLEDAKTVHGRLQQDLDNAKTSCTEADIRCRETERRVQEARGEDESVAGRAARIRTLRDAAKAVLDSSSALAAAQDAARVADADLAEHLGEQGFESVAALLDAHLTRADQDVLATLIAAFDHAEAGVAATLADPDLADLPLELTPLDGLAERRAELSAARDIALRTQGSVASRVDQLKLVVAQLSNAQQSTAALRESYDQVRELAAVVQGNEPNAMRMRLETYVLAAELEEIVAAANVRLRSMTSGRFALEHDDSKQYRNARSGLGLAILDQHTGRARATHSLSGGETFLASLALALGLAEVVSNQAGGITLDTLFVDEGFGSLDEDTLGIAMSTLDSLRAGGRTIGLISHVNTMKEQIPAKVRIRVTDDGSSEVVQEAYAGV